MLLDVLPLLSLELPPDAVPAGLPDEVVPDVVAGVEPVEAAPAEPLALPVALAAGLVVLLDVLPLLSLELPLDAALGGLLEVDPAALLD